ncbi:hypothetical protein IGS59_14765 [Janthinobacterium sp. GW460P]|uniref:hypothetical protein n=1 Tax=unclassified Janthinobacterium TaxID=2610881 RepID=UPI000A31F481|nr:MULTISPECIES: hypothetical protein [unclassified Janthinobacterium]MCC7703509.1 hypothetical protein [Janthinobacterium sp. GW460P]MCC7709016.1 hypothetical protein [Janthinobacterium sp. GW460W]
MTRVPKARLVLQDAMFVREKLENELGHIEWRLYWVLAVVLLRAVGHVLDKVDGNDDPAVKREANTLHKSWRSGDENAIFRDFIERERNSILKEYESEITEGPVAIMAHLQQHDGFDVVRQFLLEENIYRPMGAGVFEGEDGRTLLDEAIAWWARQLGEVDRRVAPSST